MAREEFYDDIRRVYGLAAFPVEAETGDPRLNTADLRRRLERGPRSVWLTPKTVEAYRPEDFADLDTGRQAELKRAVEAFRAAVAGVKSNGAPTDEQLREAAPAFAAVLSVVRRLAREEWVAEVDRRLTEAEGWCANRGWLARKKPRPVKDHFLGAYEAPQLDISAFDNHFLLAPVARFAPGASGLLELALLPSYESVMVVRSDGRWYIHPVEEGGRRRPWSESAFADALTQLSARA
jgi:hypothetical protein